MIYGRKGLAGAEDWLSRAGSPGSKNGGKPGVSGNTAGSVEKNSAVKGKGGRSRNTADTLSHDLAAIDAVLSGKMADYNERIKRAQAAYDADRLRAGEQRDDALRKAYIAARQAGRVLPQGLAGRGAGGGLALQESRRIAADYQHSRRTAQKEYDAAHSALEQTFSAEESKVRALIAKAQAAAQADRVEAMAKAARG